MDRRRTRPWRGEVLFNAHPEPSMATSCRNKRAAMATELSAPLAGMGSGEVPGP